MAKQVILAVAGAGKTHYISRAIDPAQKNLILAFTHENIRNIHKELIEAHGTVPELTTVMTFDSFVYRFLVCPYEPTILRHFGRDDYKTRGITLRQPPPMQIKSKDGESIPNPKYKKDVLLEHYVTAYGQYYNANTAKLVMKVKKKKEILIKKAADTWNLFFDKILIDEFQDFRIYYFELILALSKSTDNILLVGDYYQHSVSALNNTGKPFQVGKGKSKAELSYTDFVQLLEKEGFNVDETTLEKSRRCPQNICDFITMKLGINIAAYNDNQGKVIWVEDNDIDDILKNNQITKLVWNTPEIYNFEAQSWSYSKGNTLDSVCVILTDTLRSLKSHKFDCNKIAKSTLNKLYVAMTRTKGNLYIMDFTVFQNAKENYIKH